MQLKTCIVATQLLESMTKAQGLQAESLMLQMQSWGHDAIIFQERLLLKISFESSGNDGKGCEAVESKIGFKGLIKKNETLEVRKQLLDRFADCIWCNCFGDIDSHKFGHTACLLQKNRPSTTLWHARKMLRDKKIIIDLGSASFEFPIQEHRWYYQSFICSSNHCGLVKKVALWLWCRNSIPIPGNVNLMKVLRIEWIKNIFFFLILPFHKYWLFICNNIPIL
jgi:hypothetical protein